MNNPDGPKDSYQQFFKLFPMEKFVEFGLENMIFVPSAKVDAEWGLLKDRINKNSNDLFVRSSGRNGNGNEILSNLYADIFKIEINFDPTNNYRPTLLLERLTGFRKNKEVINYQVSHLFGNTKNVYSFTAPWNIAFIPKLIDPFTGHEANGQYVSEFQIKFRALCFATFGTQVRDYNLLMKDLAPRVRTWVSKYVDRGKQDSISKDFSEIQI